MTDKEYIDTLSAEELRAVCMRFLSWERSGQCPVEYNRQFPCRWSKDKDFDAEAAYYACPYGSCRCWVEFYAWECKTQGRKNSND